MKSLFAEGLEKDEKGRDDGYWSTDRRVGDLTCWTVTCVRICLLGTPAMVLQQSNLKRPI